MKEYFAVYLKDGNRFDFDKRCSIISFTDSNVMVFKEVDKKAETEMVLAVIPYSSINYVLKRGE